MSSHQDRGYLIVSLHPRGHLLPSRRVASARPKPADELSPTAPRSSRHLRSFSSGRHRQLIPIMPREGTRSQTGNSRPRIFQAVDTGPATTRRKPSLKSRLTPGGVAKPVNEKKGKDTDKVKQQKKKAGARAGGGTGGGVVDKVRSAVGLAPREPSKVQKKGGVKRAVQKVVLIPCVE